MDMQVKEETGFSAVEMLLCLIIVVMITFVGYYIYHTQQTANATYKDASNAAQASVPRSVKKSSAPIATTTPALTNYGYLTITDMHVKIKLSKMTAGATYSYLSDSPDAVSVTTPVSDAIVGPAGKACKGEYVAYISRTAKGTDVSNGEAALFSEDTTIGNYTYRIATKKQYGPECFETSATKGDPYVSDTATAQKFADVVIAFKEDFKTITAAQ